MECITAEICMEKFKNVIISCMYRKLGSNIEIFTENMKRMFIKVKQKVNYICGDFNIDLLNPNKRKLTNEFTEVMYSMGLFPTITKPTRIISHGATLIDNIFTTKQYGKQLCR